MEYLNRKRKERLYKQWVKQSGLPTEEVPPDLLDEHSAEETELASDDIRQERLPQYTAMIDMDRGMLHIPIRYVLFGLSIIALLLIVLSVVITILIVQS